MKKSGYNIDYHGIQRRRNDGKGNKGYDDW